MSKRERTTAEIRETVEAVTDRDGWACYVCGEKPGNQLAHRLPQDVLHLARFGAAVIHHPLNLRWVCSLACNAKVQVNARSRPVEAAELAEEIRNAENV